MPVPANWATMTDAEKRAWAEQETAPKRKSAAKPAAPATPSVESQVDELYSRKGGYLRPRNQSTDHMN